MAEIHRLITSRKSEPDKILSDRMGELSSVVVIGWSKDGQIVVDYSEGEADTLWMIEQAKRQLLEGEDD